ncbi:hypothetical protein Tco_1404758 [Tanacetum coccineum]
MPICEVGKRTLCRNCPSQGMEEIEELSANICLMARIQPADQNSDDEPSYESAFITDDEWENMFKKTKLSLNLYNINKDNNYLNEFLEADERAKRYNKQAQSQLVRDRDIIRDLEKQRDKLDLDVKNYKRKNEELQKTHSILKRQMSEKEDTYHDTILDLEAKLKKNVDLILKLGNSLQGMFMLGPKPLSVYDQQLKHGLGYPNPYTLKQAISKCPKLYVASSLGNLEIPLNVRDSEDTLEDAFKSQQKMTEKMNDPIAVANKQNCWTINYKKLNALYKDFVPQKELSVEQKYFSSSSIPSVKIPVSKNMPSESPLIKELDKIKVCFEKLSLLIQQNCKRASIFYTSPAEIQINDFCQDQVKPILNELKVYLEFFRNLFQRDIKEMKDVFESTESELDELEKQNDLLKDQLLEASLKHDVELCVLLNHECVDKILSDELDQVKKKSFEIQEGLQSRIKILEKDVQRCQKQSVDFELKLQHEKEKHKWDSTSRNKNTNPLDYSWISKLEKLENENVSLDFKVVQIVLWVVDSGWFNASWTGEDHSILEITFIWIYAVPMRVRILQKITRKRSKPGKLEHENGKSAQKPEVSSKRSTRELTAKVSKARRNIHTLRCILRFEGVIDWFSEQMLTSLQSTTHSEPAGPFWGADDEEVSEGRHSLGPENLQTPPVPQDEDEREPVITGTDPDTPEDPQTLPVPQDEDEHDFPAEEQPLPLIDSPTAESPGHVTESDPKEDPEEYEDDETEDGPVDYPMDGGDDGDDDDDDSSRDDADGENEDEEDEEEEEEEHLAPADSTTVIPVDELVFPPEGTKPVILPPSTNINIRARITVRPQTSISLPPEAEVERLLTMTTPSPSPPISLSPPSTGERLARCMAPPVHSPPLLPSSGCPTQIQTLRIASTQALIDAITAAFPSPPLPPLPPSLYIPPPVDRRDDIPESEQLPRKRLYLSALGSRYKVGESSTARPTRGQGIDYGLVSTVDAEERRQGIRDVGYGFGFLIFYFFCF